MVPLQIAITRCLIDPEQADQALQQLERRKGADAVATASAAAMNVGRDNANGLGLQLMCAACQHGAPTFLNSSADVLNPFFKKYFIPWWSINSSIAVNLPRIYCSLMHDHYCAPPLILLKPGTLACLLHTLIFLLQYQDCRALRSPC